MSNKKLTENEFSPSPGGASGTSNYQTGYGTHSSPDVSQNSNHFATGDSIGTHSNTKKDPSNPSEAQKLLDIIYSRPNPPSPDDIVAAVKRVMGNQIKKDSLVAKLEVLKNMVKNPNMYKGLQDMGIDDKTMMDTINENRHPNDAPARSKVTANVDETKKIFSELVTGRDNKYVVNSGISEVMKQMWKVKENRNNWRSFQ
jgi:hypothetical protein